MTQITSAELNEQLVTDFTDWQRMCARSPQTVLQYAALLRVWAAFIDKDVRTALPEDVADFVRRPRGHRAHGAMGSPATRNRDVAILSAFYQWAIDMGEMDRSPTKLVARAKVRNRRSKALDDKDWLRTWDAANELDRVWLGLGMFCGFRAAEIVSLRCEQVTDTAVVGFVRKGGHEDTWPLAEVLSDTAERLPWLQSAEWLETLRSVAIQRGKGGVCDFIGYRVADSEKATLRYGDGVIYDPTVLNRRLARIHRVTGVTPFSPHALRHSAITNWLRMGYPLHIVQVLAAHSSSQITARYMAGSMRMLADWRASGGAHT